MLKKELLHRAHNSEIDMLQWRTLYTSRDSLAHKCLKTEMSHTSIEPNCLPTLLETSQKEADEFGGRQNESEAAISTEMTSCVEDLEKRLQSQDVDVTQIQATREEARSGSHELRSRDAEKTKQVTPIRTLVTSCPNCVSASVYEVWRLIT
ncbi:uncharacterized protein MELLADRAFT_84252 [Melampsora larici-populina 98AG31]|uniref:Uncharacterized protein n=1 Tax=Melampsora larici-populina (strain 98AG31 / pathotype 3-4-7) TaxID=747676 RepID=F4RF21_MELLP|nr:uncharacterized protein MELLADRAFT_84252 [Melampsora larici-populina 98AG31]EGG09014.1 hypothetical protein MELLADRAFT_84252 [Melampsora larici-populina 98AG31]